MWPGEITPPGEKPEAGRQGRSSRGRWVGRSGARGPGSSPPELLAPAPRASGTVASGAKLAAALTTPHPDLRPGGKEERPHRRHLFFRERGPSNPLGALQTRFQRLATGFKSSPRVRATELHLRLSSAGQAPEQDLGPPRSHGRERGSRVSHELAAPADTLCS